MDDILKVYLSPRFAGEDEGEGGIRRIVEAQRRHMPAFGFEFVDSISDADIVATHAGDVPNVPPHMPWIVHTHGMYWTEYDWPRWCHALNRQVVTAARRSDHVTAPSEWVAQTLRRGMWLNPTVLHHGIDLDEWTAELSAGYVLWNKTRIDAVCDPEPVVNLALREPGLQFLSTFGDSKIPNLSLTGRLPFEASKELIKRAGVYLCTTRETFGIGTIEAMACKVPVVAWDWGGQREIIKHRINGWLAPPGDLDGLIEGIYWAFQNRESVGEEAWRTVRDRFTWDVIIPQYAHLYQDVWLDHVERYQSPRVSIVMPCYNLGRYLSDAVQSVQSQSMENWELVIVDDASTDDSGKVADELALTDERIKVIHNEQNQYLAGALNTGIRESSGRYVMALDSDNMIESWTLNDLANALDRDRSVDIAYGAARFVKENGKTPDDTVSPDGISRWPTEFVFANQIQHRNQIPSTCLYRRKVWERTGGYRTRCRTAEDAEMWTRATSLGFSPFKVTNRPTLIYRQREDSMSRIEADWDWTGWFPWSRLSELTPFGVEDDPPRRINDGLSWNVPSYEPVKIAVIIPVGPGHQELIIDALDSLQAQTFQQWECIVINDTGEAVDIPHSWARIIETEGKRGPAYCRNLGIQQVKSPLFVPLDADDYLQPEALRLMYETYQQFGGVVYSQFWDNLNEQTRLYDPSEFDAGRLMLKGQIYAVTALYPRAAWIEVGGFDEQLKNWEDWDFQINVALKGYCATKIPIPLFTYRKHTGLRREENMLRFEEGKTETLEKWKRNKITQEALIMACQGCPKGGGGSYSQGSTLNRSRTSSGPREGYALIEYVGTQPGTRTWKGAKTGTPYRFGANSGGRQKYVYEDDVPTLLTLRENGQPLFRVKDSRPAPITNDAVLDTPGPRRGALIEHVEPVQTIERPFRNDGETLARVEDNTLIETASDTEDTGSFDVSKISVRELRNMIDTMTAQDIALALARERATHQRTTVINILSNALSNANG